MKLENKFCTAMQAKKLQELGVSAGATFYYIKQDDNYILVPQTHLIVLKEEIPALPAYSAIEILSALPNCIVANAGDKYYATTDEYHNYDLDNALPEGWDNTQCDPWYIESCAAAWCLTDLLIFMIESKLITSEQVNASLLA